MRGCFRSKLELCSYATSLSRWLAVALVSAGSTACTSLWSSEEVKRDGEPSASTPGPKRTYLQPATGTATDRSARSPAVHAVVSPLVETKRATPEPPCPEEMAEVPLKKGSVCVDRWEASLVHGTTSGSRKAWPGNQAIDDVPGTFIAVSKPNRMPQGYISGEQAAEACHAANKRLCTPAEWDTACRGPKRTRYPYGEVRRANVCNDRFKWIDKHPVTRLFAQEAPEGTPRWQMWSLEWMNDPRLHELDHSVKPTGSHARCSNEHGIYDMVGNLHEWIDDPSGTFAGGFFMDTFQNGEGCFYRTTAHSTRYHDYSTGFRCCADPSR